MFHSREKLNSWKGFVCVCLIIKECPLLKRPLEHSILLKNKKFKKKWRKKCQKNLQFLLKEQWLSSLGKEQKVPVWPRGEGALCPVGCPCAGDSTGTQAAGLSSLAWLGTGWAPNPQPTALRVCTPVLC